MTAKYFIAAVCCFLSFTTTAQDSNIKLSRKGYERHFGFGGALVTHTLYDNAISSVRYGGTSAAPVFGHVKTNGAKYSEWDLHGSFMKYKTRLSSKLLPMRITNLRFALDYQRLQRVPRWSEKVDVSLGGSASFLFTFKQAPQIDNSQLVMEYAFGAGPAAMVAKRIDFLKRDWTLRYQLHLPLVAFMYRPPYLNRVEFFNPENELVGYTLRNSAFATVEKYLRIDSRLSVARMLSNGNALRLGYRWDFYRMKTVSRAFATEHQLSFTFLFNY